MPLREAMPTSAMKPTIAAIVSVCCVSTSAATAPMNAIGSAAITCSARFTEWNILKSTRKMPTSAATNSTAIVRDADCWLSNWPPYSTK